MMNPFQQEVLGFIISCYSHEIVINVSVSRYPVIEIPLKQLAFHIVPIQDNQDIRLDDKMYFAGLSDTYFRQKHYKLIHIWEDLWHNRKEQVQSRIKLLTGNFIRIHARKTLIKRIDKTEAEAFLNTNHVYGYTTAKYKYGMYHENLLVAVATFSGLRTYWRNAGTEACKSGELIRFANLNGYSVAGGLSKFIAHFIREHQPDDIMTYADRDWSTGESYRKIGFEEIEQTPPQLFWVHPSNMVREYPHHLYNKFKGHTSPEDLTIFLIQNGYCPVYNAGNIKFLLYLKRTF